MVIMLKICLFGKFGVYEEETAVTGFEARRVQELFSYLLLLPYLHHPRESIAALLWHNQPTAQSKKYLRHALWQLQTALENHLPAQQSPLLVDPEWLSIGPNVTLNVDADLFAQAFAAVRGIPGRYLTPQQHTNLVQAVNLYQGDLLAGWYQDWCLYQRERFQNMYLAMLDKLMGYCEAFQAYEEGIYYGTRILAVDSARERAHRRLMRLQYLSGDRTAALRQYQRCVQALREELDVEPAHSTQAIYAQIRADALVDDLLPHTIHTPGELNLPQTMLYLQQLQTLLNEIQTQLQNQIQTMQGSIKT
jgi:DNA-binding SARP family transcriptional activator